MAARTSSSSDAIRFDNSRDRAPAAMLDLSTQHRNLSLTDQLRELGAQRLLELLDLADADLRGFHHRWPDRAGDLVRRVHLVLRGHRRSESLGQLLVEVRAREHDV